MKNQYTWLRANIDKYQFNTDEAKKLYEEIVSADSEDGMQPNGGEPQMSEDCYNRIVKMFNNNPFSYKYGLKDFEIETSESDCYFVNINDDFVPIGYYKEKHPVESVLLLNEKIDKQKNRAADIKSNLVKKFEQEAQTVKTGYEKFKKAKKTNGFRALISAISAIMIVWYFIDFMKITDTVGILKCIGNKQVFNDKVTIGMSAVPVFSETNIVGWVLLTIIHVFLIIMVSANLKNITKEFILAYQRGVASCVEKTTAKSIKKINEQFGEELERDTQSMLFSARQGTTEFFEKGKIANIIKKTRKKLKLAEEYTQKKYADLRGVKNNSTVFLLVFAACAGCFSYTFMRDSEFKTDFETKLYEAQVTLDGEFTRSKKMIQIITEDCPVYASSAADSKVKCNLPIWSEAELKGKKTIGEESWSKIKKITDTQVFYGWVPTECTVPHNYVNYDNFTEAGIASAEASSHLVGKKTEYVPEFAYDWNRQTSWQDGNENSTGEGEYILLNFEQPTKIKMIQVFPGNAKSEELYFKNERIKKAKIKFSNGESVKYEFDDLFGEPLQTIWLNKEVETEFIKIEVLEVYNGEEYKDLCVSEIHAYSENQN